MRLTTNTYVHTLFSKNPSGFQFKRRSQKKKRRSHKFHYLAILCLTTPPICRSTALYERHPSVTKKLKEISYMESQSIPLTEGSSFCPCLHVHVNLVHPPGTITSFRHVQCFYQARPLVRGNPTVPSCVVSVWKQERTEQHCPVCQYLVWSSE